MKAAIRLLWKMFIIYFQPWTIYEVRALGASEDDSVKETAVKILNGLQFK